MDCIENFAVLESQNISVSQYLATLYDSEFCVFINIDFSELFVK